MELEYWRNRFSSNINYDTMTGWVKEIIKDETNKLYEFFKYNFSDLEYKKVFDYGCGYGRFSYFFINDLKQYVGTDIIKEVIDKNRFEYPGRDFEYIYEYKKEDTDDLVFLCTVFQYFDDTEAEISLTSEFDNAKNILIIESLAKPNAFLQPHEHNRKPEEIKKIAVNNGWKIQKEAYFTSRENYYFIWITK
jgi:SAM-dependent methyltransferase